jgi:hypothetical protein
VYVSVCVCMRVRVRERERKRDCVQIVIVCVWLHGLKTRRYNTAHQCARTTMEAAGMQQASSERGLV